jgi:hypothetical protein
MAATTSSAVPSPSAMISPSAIRRPSRATAQRSSVFTQNVMPGANTGRRATTLSAIPIASAITIAGIGNTGAIRGAAATAATATTADNAKPGASTCSVCPMRGSGALVERFAIEGCCYSGKGIRANEDLVGPTGKFAPCSRFITRRGRSFLLPACRCVERRDRIRGMRAA